MKNMFLYLCVRIRELALRESGQDLVEYALVVALISFAAAAGMGQLATAINAMFSNISSQIASSM